MYSFSILFPTDSQVVSPALSPVRVLDPVDELEEATAKNPIIMENPTTILIRKGNVGLGISIVGGNDTPLVSVLLMFVYRLFQINIFRSYIGIFQKDSVTSMLRISMEISGGHGKMMTSN